MIGNVDAHAKNHALLYVSAIPTLAPRYDVLPTRLDPNLTDEFSFKIGRAAKTSELTKHDLYSFLAMVGISNDRAKKRLLDQYTKKLIAVLAPNMPRLDNDYGRSWGDLIASNVRHLAGVLGLEVPDVFQNRDVFVAKAGGWVLS